MPSLMVLHGTWLPRTGAASCGRFLVWAEGSSRGARGRPASPPAHPFIAAPAAVKDAVPGLGSAGQAEHVLTLPGGRAGPRPSHVLLQEALGRGAGGALSFSRWRVRGSTFLPGQAPGWLEALDAEALRAGAVLLGEDLVWWKAAARLAADIIAGEHYLPALRDGARAVWEPLVETPGVAARFAGLAEAAPASCLAFCLDPKNGTSSVDASGLLGDFLAAAVDAEVRAAAGRVWPGSRPNSAHDVWLAALAAPSAEVDLEPEEAVGLRESLSSWRGRLAAASGAGLRVCLRLKPPGEGAKTWRLTYLIQAASDPSLLVEAGDVWSATPARRRLAEASGSDPEERLLAGLALAARVFAPIEASLKTARPGHALLDTAAAYRFLMEAAPVLSDSGFGVLLPPWWRTPQAPRLGVQLTLKPRPGAAGMMGMDSLLEFDWKLALGGQALSEREFSELARLKVPLVQVRGHWVEVDAAALAKAAETWRRHEARGLSFGEALKALGAGRAESPGLAVSDIRAEGWVKELLGAASAEAAFTALPAPRGLRAALRPYQARGFSWLAFLKACGFGACLADDMGLGKTVQALALLVREKEEGRLKSPALLLAPTSVVGNWRKEAGRFAPGLKVLVHHGLGRKKTGPAFLRQARSHDLVITTYALARRDERLLSSAAWGGVLLDEAQNVKNPGSGQSRAARALKGGFRVALTGTPVENRLSELWSVMEFINPGYLGGLEEFQRRFTTPIERFQDAGAAETLRRMAQPFILRRLKTDRSIISDLPDKLEMKVYCTLTKEQATLYKAVTSDMLAQIAAADGIKRRGLVLAAITKLKQVLNHPAQFLKDGSALPGRSGKLERLGEMLEEALAAGDSALVFTQYAEMGELLKKRLQEATLEEALFFHGGLSRPAREDMVERFQAGAPRIMVLTVKAGGTGLNLTRASHVFHYDRWWNPAVENQATDRAFRIGQTRKVQVHKFLCSGTLEEKIDAMIESKKALAEKVLGAGESWLTELSNAQLKDVFALREEALADA